REAITHSQLDHANILPFSGIYHEALGSPPIIILPLCEGGSLADLLFDETLMKADNFVVGITRGVGYLHSRNPPTIHGDLHPGNVLLGKDGNPYLCDFGLSRIRHEVTRTNTLLREGGRIRFLAPELSSGFEEQFRTSKASDIFGLAMTLFNTWTSKTPFSEVINEQKVLSNFIKGERPERPASAVALGSDVNTILWNLLVDMWAQRPEQRPPIDTVLTRLEYSLASVHQLPRK
ncbi:kinase-like protein, partial [Clavulina sp. PMI_390]